MGMDLTGITNKNEYYTNHYFATVFEENAGETISAWNTAARESEEIRTPWSMLRRNASQFYAAHDRYTRSSLSMQSLYYIKELADAYLHALGYPEKAPLTVSIDDTLSVPVYLEMKKQNGAPLLWVILMASVETDAGIMESYPFEGAELDESSYGQVYKGTLGTISGEELSTKILFGQQEPPRFLILIGMNQIALIDRNKWNEKRYLQFELEEIFSRLENTTLQAMSVLLHKDSLCPDDGKILLDELDEQSQRNASGVSQDLKYALRESIELLGNEVLYDMRTRQGRDLEAAPVDAGQLTIECLRYMYRMLFVLFIEARPELGYAPIKAQSYYTGYSLESLRDIADNIRDDINEVGDGYYLHETLAKLYDLIYNGYPKTEEELKKATGAESLHDMFLVAPLKAHIFDPEYTKMITAAKLRNSCMLRIIELMSLTRATGKKNSRRGRISYANLGINQMGAVYEALLSYRGFIAEHDLYEVKRANDSFNELDVGYFVSESELNQYDEDERVRYDTGEKKGKLRMYEKGTFIYRLAGREREKSASYYTPEVLTKCLVKYALKELLEGKSADEILELTVCEPAMGSAAFLNETINQLAEAYITRKEQETGNVIGYEDRFNELQKVKMYIADRNVYGIDLNPVAVELAEVSLWLNTIYEGGFVPWFGTQLVNGNSLIGARRQVYSETLLQTSSKGLRWFENAPDRVPLGTARKKRRGNTQIYHFLLGDPGMCSYSDKVIKSLEPNNIKTMKNWNKKFTAPYTDSELETLRQLSSIIDDLWEDQIKLRQTVEAETQDTLSVFGHEDTIEDSHTTIRQKDLIFSKLYKSEHMKNAGPYARLKFAMDYWCALWFWPIDKAELLPSRSEFFSDLNWILVGTVSTGKGQASIGYDQLSIFDDDNEELQLIHKINEIQGGSKTQVDLDSLCLLFPRLALVRQIAEQNHFMHWELEFADLFAEKGGFDLVLGNPPWVKIEWKEQNMLSDKNPRFAIKALSAIQTARLREAALNDSRIYSSYFYEYQNMSGEQAFLNGQQNYPELKGQQTNLYKCFLPQAFMYVNGTGVSAFLHPDGVFDDPKGELLRGQVYKRLRYHFQFKNELKLFSDIHNETIYGINIYCNNISLGFDSIVNLFSPSTIEECYIDDGTRDIPGIKDSNNNWELHGHRQRIVHIGKEELKLFARYIDRTENWKGARLPVLHAKPFLEVVRCFAEQKTTIASLDKQFFSTELWHETNAQKDKTIKRIEHFPASLLELIYSGSHIGVANPLYQASMPVCNTNRAFLPVDLTVIPKEYRIRCNYIPNCSADEYARRSPKTPWGNNAIDNYRVIMRNMFNLSSERTLFTAIVPPQSGHVHAVYEISFSDVHNTVILSAMMASIELDALLRILGKGSGGINVIKPFPVLDYQNYPELMARVLMLNCLNSDYADLWKVCWDNRYKNEKWAKDDSRLSNKKFSSLSSEWKPEYAFRTDFERRQALIEIDVIVAKAIGLSIEQLKTLYRIQFPVMVQYEMDTWFDKKGRIVFTPKSIGNLTVKRTEWEKSNSIIPIQKGNNHWDGVMKNAPMGYSFARTIIDETLPRGPVERTIEYVAPFDRCDRVQDYEIVWKFFEEKCLRKE